jgi:hypothetical protein
MADVLLPIAPFTETAGTFVNAEGRVQSFHGVVKPLGDARPAWKVLRVLGNLLGLPASSTSRRRGARRGAGRPVDAAARLDNAPGRDAPWRASAVRGLQRVADVPIYAADPLVRRAPSLQLTADARAPRAACRRRCGSKLGLARRQGAGAAGRGGPGAAGARTPRWRPTPCASPPATRHCGAGPDVRPDHASRRPDPHDRPDHLPIRQRRCWAPRSGWSSGAWSRSSSSCCR